MIRGNEKPDMFNKINISPGKQKLIVYIVLTVVTFAVFWQVNLYGFVNFDDPVYVIYNSHIQSGLSLAGLRWAFCTTYAEFWHPVTWFSLMLDYQFYGMNAGGYHLTNLILHILSALMLFWLFCRMTGAIWRSAFVSALFALHPLHVESVAWIAERKDVLSAFFWMLTLCFYVYYTEKPVIKRYLLVVFCFVLALMSKPMVVTLPVIMILLDYWPLGRFQQQEITSAVKSVMPLSINKEKRKRNPKDSLKDQRLKNISLFNNRKIPETRIARIIPLWQLLEKTPFFILSAIFSIIAVYAQYNPYGKHLPLSFRFAGAPVFFVLYLERTFIPHNLAVYYTLPGQFPIWEVLVSTLLVMVISVAVFATLKRLPYLFVGWLWYVITLLPVIKIVEGVYDAMADRYHYLPSVGIAIGLAWGIPLLSKHEDTRKKILFPIGIAFIAILAVLAWQQCHYWENSKALFTHALQAKNNNYMVHNCLGIVLFDEGKMQEAMDHYNEAIRLKPDNTDAYFNKGNVYAKRGDYQRAFENYNEAIRLKPDNAAAYNNRGKVFENLSEYESAIGDYNEAIRLKPDNVLAYYNRGNLYDKLGRYQLAIENYDEAIRLKPDNAAAYCNKGMTYARIGQYQHAIEDFNDAIRLQQDYADAYNGRGIVYLSQGNSELGCRDAQKACELGNCKALELAKGRQDCL